MIDAQVQRAIAEAADETNDVIAAFGSYDRPLASASSGTLRARRVDDGVAVAIDLPDDEAGRAVLAAQESAGVVVRPVINADEVTASQIGDTMHYGPAGDSPVRAFIVSATDQREGWPTPRVFDAFGDEVKDVWGPMEGRASGLVVPRRRRVLACL